MDSLLWFSQQGPCFTTVENDGQHKGSAKSLLGAEAMPLFHILASLVVADVAMAILIFTASMQEPSLESDAPKYLVEVTSSKVFPFMVMFALMSFMLLTIIFYFSVLTSVP